MSGRSDKYGFIVSFRVNDSEAEALDEARADMSRSEYIRYAVFGADPKAIEQVAKSAEEAAEAAIARAEARADRAARRVRERADRHAHSAARKLRRAADAIDPHTPTDSPNESSDNPEGGA